jgi:hypothetical protein
MTNFIKLRLLGAPSFPHSLRKGWDTTNLDRPFSTPPQIPHQLIAENYRPFVHAEKEDGSGETISRKTAPSILRSPVTRK